MENYLQKVENWGNFYSYMYKTNGIFRALEAKRSIMSLTYPGVCVLVNVHHGWGSQTLSPIEFLTHDFNHRRVEKDRSHDATATGYYVTKTLKANMYRDKTGSVPTIAWPHIELLCADWLHHLPTGSPVATSYSSEWSMSSRSLLRGHWSRWG